MAAGFSPELYYFNWGLHLAADVSPISLPNVAPKVIADRHLILGMLLLGFRIADVTPALAHIASFVKPSK